MKHQVSASAKCPYYKCEERHEIFCEGPQDRSSTHVAFAIPMEKKDYMCIYCKDEDGWKDCPVAMALQLLGK